MTTISSVSSSLSDAPAARREAIEIAVIRQAAQADRAAADLVASAVEAGRREIPAVPVDRSVGSVVDRRI